MNKLQRAQILLEPEQHRELSELARQGNSSISELIRSAVSQFLDERRGYAQLRQRLEAIEKITLHRQAILARRNGRPLDMDIVALIEEMREERDVEHNSPSF